MGQKLYIREMTIGPKLRDGITAGVTKVFAVAQTAYGAASGNVIIENRADVPTISHDGVTNIAALEAEDPIEDMAISVIKQASKRTNDTAGDGTTLSAVLAYHLYIHAEKDLVQKQGMSRAAAAKKIRSYIPTILAAIDAKTKKDITDKNLRGVCEISAGDSGLGALVYDVISKVGLFGGVNVIYTGTSTTSVDFVNGVYIESGAKDEMFFNDQTSKESVMKPQEDCDGVPVVILGATIARQDEIVPIIEKLNSSRYKQVLIFGNVINDALKFLSTLPKPLMDIMVVTPPSNGFSNNLEDIALYSSGEVFRGEPKDWTPEMLGWVESATITRNQTTITGGKGANSKKLATAIEKIKKQRDGVAPNRRLEYENRIARLTASIANIYVGGASDTERKETKLRIDDAVCAAKTALTGGIVAGGGVCLRDIGTKTGLAYLTKPYYDLLLNSDATPEMIRDKCEIGEGYDLLTHEKRNMVRANIIDPAIVIREAVINSHSVVAQLITTNLALTFKERDQWN